MTSKQNTQVKTYPVGEYQRMDKDNFRNTLEGLNDDSEYTRLLLSINVGGFDIWFENLLKNLDVSHIYEVDDKFVKQINRSRIVEGVYSYDELRGTAVFTEKNHRYTIKRFDFSVKTNFIDVKCDELWQSFYPTIKDTLDRCYDEYLHASGNPPPQDMHEKIFTIPNNYNYHFNNLKGYIEMEFTRFMGDSLARTGKNGHTTHLGKRVDVYTKPSTDGTVFMVKLWFTEC